MRDAIVYELLAAAGAVTALVGDRIYPSRAPQDAALPYVTYQLVSGVADSLLEGGTSMDAIRVQVDAWATGKPAADALALVCRTALEYDGAVTGIGPNGPDDDAPSIWRSSADYEFWISV